jgi:DNA invertase Pin-like site-specific DNA recombinase
MTAKNQKLRVAIYARVSTSDKGQDPALQLTPLSDYCKQRGWQIVGHYVDHGTGKTAHRPELDKLLDAARKRQINCVVVWKLDRFGRSMQHLVNTLVELQGLGVSFVSYMENLDFTSASGKLMFNILASFAQFERDIISDRVRAGILNAKSKGIRVGRKPITPGEHDRIVKLKKEGFSIRQISKQVRLAVGTVHKTLPNKAPGKALKSRSSKAKKNVHKRIL